MESGHVNRYWLCVHLPGLPFEMHARDAADEAAMLARLAAWCGQFSSFISISVPHTLVLEAGGSLKLFGGIGRLAARVKSGLRALGVTARVAAAPTPLAAELLAWAGKETFVHVSELPRALGTLPVEVLPLDAAQLRLLHGMGLHLIGDVMRLPRDGLARRLGPALVTVLDRALGSHADARVPFVPPARFHARLELPAPTGNLEALAFALQRLLREMEGFLRARQAGVRAFQLRFFHVRSRKGVSTLFPVRKKGTDPFSVTIIEMPLLTCARDAAHLLKLARTRLESIALPETVEAIALDAATIETLPERSRGFAWGENRYASDPVFPASLAFIERLQARLGEAAVRNIECVADHRPERAFCVRPLRNVTSGPTKQSSRAAVFARPLWLLREAMPLTMHDNRPTLDGTLELDINRERIESGWWDGQPIARDYFIARDRRGRRLWVYRDLASGGWFLQGMFG